MEATMAARGKPMDPGSGKHYAVLCCPMCERMMNPIVVMSLGPSQAPDDERIETPFYRYVCVEHGAVEMHMSRVVEPA